MPRTDRKYSITKTTEGFEVDGIRMEMNREKRKELCSEVQKILANEVPYVPLWFKDVTSVHRRETGEIALSPAGGYEFLASN